MGSRLNAAAAGVLAAGAGVAAAELLAAATRPAAGPLIAVGGAVIDATPAAVKEFAVRQLGTGDKPVLLTSIAVVLALFAAAVGAAARWHPAAAGAGAAVLGAAGVAAALSRPAATWFDAVPSLLAAILAGVVLILLVRRLPAGTPAHHQHTETAPDPIAPAVPDRRAFLRAAALVAAGAVAAEAGALTAGRVRGGAAGRSRVAVRLPAPAAPAGPLPAGVEPGFTTPAALFYRVDTALTVPRIDPSRWRLRIHGMVGREATLSFADLLGRPLIERDITLNCVSNEVGGPYIGTARWLGVPLGPLLRELGVDTRADQIVARSAEGMSSGTPVAAALDGRDTMLAVGMNGEPLPLEHGFPVRMLTPGLYGYAGSCKWLDEIELTRFDRFDAYWVRRGWSRAGTVRTASRIDRPKPFARLAAGTNTVAGVAWAQRRGIAKVEVSIDGGLWRAAELRPVPSADTWVQWRCPWTAPKGPHSIRVRATDGTGAVQPETRATPFPAGATGWHTITVTAR